MARRRGGTPPPIKVNPGLGAGDGPDIADEAVVGGTPGGQWRPPIPGRPVTFHAASTRQYVAGGRPDWYINFPKALPWGIDDLSVDFGLDIYRRMMLDPQVRSVINVFKASVLETGITVTSAVEKRDEDGYQEAFDLVTRLEWMLDNLSVSLDDVLWDMLSSMAYGSRTAELVYDLDGDPVSGQPWYWCHTMAVRPFQSTAFVVDAFMNTIAVLGRIPGQPFGVQQGMLLAEVEQVANILPRSKFAVHSWRPENHDPRGTSLLRPAYQPWNAKSQLLKEYLKYLTQFASPSLLGFTAPQALAYQAKNPDGTLKVDADGIPVTVNPEQDMLTAMVAMQNSTAAVFADGARVEPLEMSGQGEAFITAFQHYDYQIVKAVLNQSLATEQGEHMARAASTVHKDILDTIVRQAKRSVLRMLRRDVLQPWLRLNGRHQLLPLLPRLGLGDTENEDVPAVWTATAALYKSGYMDASQLDGFDRAIGAPPRAGITTDPPADPAAGDPPAPAAPAPGNPPLEAVA